ncbi:MAG: argininosuccinate lyase [Alphaproteobacteria bacterium]|nr:argininosuccinate lyase [Alphaproteobacteria bacterium]
MSADTPGRSLGGRFAEATHPVLERINRSVEVDKRLWAQDLRGSAAHARMLAKVGLITADERDALLEGLRAVHEELEQGTFVFLPSDEDIHMAVERRLGERIGEPARKLHTGRSRNDQVLTDVLLWLRDELPGLRGDLVAYVEALVTRAEEGVGTPMPSFTHLQPAQVSSVGQWLCAHAAEVAGHLRRLDHLLERLDACPLGSGASAGGYLPLDRAHTAEALGFARPSLNATQTTGSRIELLDVLGLLTLVGVSLSRLGEELVVFCSPSFGFVALPDRLTTGSSLLPHKRNPDGAELLRSGGKLAAAELAGLASVTAGLVSGYSKDLQGDKALLFAAWDRTRDLLALATVHVDALTWRADRLRAACGPELAALWLADRLVLAGLPFREAHHLVGLAAREGDGDLAEGFRAALAAHATPVPEAQAIAAELAAQTPEGLLAALKTEGSAGPESVRGQIAVLKGIVGR